MSAKKTLHHWLAEDDLEKVFHGLFFLADKYKEQELHNSVILQSGSFKALEKGRINGTSSKEENHMQSAKIRHALLQITKELPDDWALDGIESAPDSAIPSPPKKYWKKYAAYFSATIALLAGIAELSGFSLSDIFIKKDVSEIPAENQQSGPKVSTTGDQSPAIITDDGEVNINYGDTKPKKDTTRTN